MCPTLPIHLISPQVTLLLSPWMKKALKGKHVANVEEVRQNTAEALKGLEIYELKNCSEQWKNISIGALHQMENTLKVTEV